MPSTERDLEIGADFYESQRKGLGIYFNDCLLPVSFTRRPTYRTGVRRREVPAEVRAIN